MPARVVKIAVAEGERVRQNQTLVVLEAMALGLPVITTRHSGASELLSPPRQGYVISDPHDADQLAWCMGQLLDPARRTRHARRRARTSHRRRRRARQ